MFWLPQQQFKNNLATPMWSPESVTQHLFSSSFSVLKCSFFYVFFFIIFFSFRFPWNTSELLVIIFTLRESSTKANLLFVSALWKVPWPEEEGKGSSRSGFSKRDEFGSQRFKHLEPSSMWRAGLPHPEGGSFSGATAAEALRPVWRTFGEDGPHLQVKVGWASCEHTDLGIRWTICIHKHWEMLFVIIPALAFSILFV